MISCYYFTLCPFSRQIYLLLLESNISTHLIHINPWEKDNDLTYLNPSMLLPILVHEKKLIIEYYPIIEYIESSMNDYKFLGDTHVEQAESRRLISWFNQKFYIEVTRYIINEKVRRIMQGGGLTPSSRNISAAQHNIRTHIAYIDFLLQRNSWLTGEKFLLPDMIAASHISILDYCSNIEWTKIPLSVKKWYSLIKSRPSFNTILEQTINNLLPPEHYYNADFF